MAAVQGKPQVAYLTDNTGNLARRNTLAATPGTIEYTLPETFHVFTIEVAVQGDDTSDVATYAEQIRQIETFELLTTEGTLIRISGGNGLDCFNYARMCTGNLFESWRQGGDAANDERVIDYLFPLGKAPFDPWFPDGSLGGIPAGGGKKIRIAFGTDANVGMDSREVTILAHGYDAPAPSKFRTAVVDSYTTVADQSRFIEVPAGDLLAKVMFFGTTEWNIDTTNVRLAIEQFHITRDKRTRLQSWHTVAGGYGTGHVECPDPARGGNPAGTDSGGMSPFPNPEWYHWILDHGNRGGGWPIAGNETVEAEGGVAEAARVYPLTWHPVTA